MQRFRRASAFVLVSLVLAATVTGIVPQAVLASTTVTVNGNDTGRTFDGIGGTSGGAATSRLLYDYPATQQQQILDYLFCSPFVTPASGYCTNTNTKYGAALQELKVEIGSDTGSIGAEPAFARTRTELTNLDSACQSPTACNLTASLCNTSRGYEWWLMQQAKDRNPSIKLYALAWGFPGYIGSDFNSTYAETDYRKYYYKVFGEDDPRPAANDVVDYLTRYLQCASIVNNTPIDYVGMWNEKGEWGINDGGTIYQCLDLCNGDPTHDSQYNTWPVSTPEWWIQRLASSISDWGISTKLVAPDLGWDPLDTFLTNCVATWCQDVYALGAHYSPDGSTSAAQALGIPLWDTEGGQPGEVFGSSPNLQSPPTQMADWAGAQYMGRDLNRSYINGHITKVLHFAAVSSYYDVVFAGEGLMYANQPWSGYYDVQKRTWVLAQWTQFTQPGSWRYIDTASCYIGTSSCATESSNTGSYVTLRKSSGSDWSIIVETIPATTSQNVTFCITPNEGLTSSGTVHGWVTNSGNSLHNFSNPTLNSNHCFTASLSSDSIYTFSTTTGQAAGTQTSPSSTSFPFPYQPNFDTQTVGNAPQDFMDMQGAFEISSNCPGSGFQGTNCVAQVTPARPIDWWGVNSGRVVDDPNGSPRPAPYSLVGDPTWANYAVYAGVNTPNVGDSISLWARVQNRVATCGGSGAPCVDGSLPAHFEFTLTKTDSTHWSWRLAAIDYQDKPSGQFVIYSTSGTATIATWTDATIKVNGHTVSAILSGTQIASFTSPSTRADYGWTSGQAGVSTITYNLTSPQPADLTTLAPEYNGGEFYALCIGTNPTQSGCQ